MSFTLNIYPTYSTYYECDTCKSLIELEHVYDHFKAEHNCKNISLHYPPDFDDVKAALSISGDVFEVIAQGDMLRQYARLLGRPLTYAEKEQKKKLFKIFRGI